MSHQRASMTFAYTANPQRHGLSGLQTGGWADIQVDFLQGPVGERHELSVTEKLDFIVSVRTELNKLEANLRDREGLAKEQDRDLKEHQKNFAHVLDDLFGGGIRG